MSSGGFGATHFSLPHQRAFILGHGTRCLVYAVLQCPCVGDEGQFSPLCSACQGTGRFYPPGQAYATTMLLHRESSLRAYLEPGTWTDGMVRATILVETHLCERDRVESIEIKDVFTDEVLVKGLDDQVRFTRGVELLLVADRAQIYRLGIDYVLTPPNLVTWLPGGQSPAFGAKYAVKYKAFPEYLVVNDSPRLRIEHGVPQSQEVILLRLDKVTKDLAP